MSEEENRDREKTVDETELEKLIGLSKEPVKVFTKANGMTVIEFEDGTTLPLHGGGGQILNYKEPRCSFCNRTKDEAKFLAAPSHSNEPLICPDCAVNYVELFASHGVEIQLNISKISPALADQLASLERK